MRTNTRATAVIIKDHSILLIHRLNQGREYWVFPGGAVEENEEITDAVIRECEEEVSIQVQNTKLLFSFVRQDDPNPRGGSREHFYFLITQFSGTPEWKGDGPELASDDNEYTPKWVNLNDIENLEKLYPEKGKEKLVNLIKTNKLNF